MEVEPELIISSNSSDKITDDQPQSLIETTSSVTKSHTLSNPSTSHNQSSLKKKIMCKFFIRGNCNKGENCQYLHSEAEKNKFVTDTEIECPMYDVGFCKNGSQCKYKHIKLNECENPYSSPQEILPIWYIEHYLDKPISIIFQELELSNSPEVKALREKYGLPVIENTNPSPNGKNDIYADKKDSIEYFLNSNKQRVKYFIVEMDKYEKVKCSMESNMILISDTMKNIFDKKDKSEIFIGIVVDNENGNYSGFFKFRNVKEGNNMRIEWLWRTKLHKSKLVHVYNKKTNKYLNEEEDGAEVDEEQGIFLCRMMLKRLTKEEVRNFMQEKKIYTNEHVYISKKEDDNINININNVIKKPNQEDDNGEVDISNNESKIYVTKINNLNVNINNHTYYNSNNNFVSNKRNRNSSQGNYFQNYKGNYRDKYENYRYNNNNNNYGNKLSQRMNYSYLNQKKRNSMSKYEEDEKPIISIDKEHKVKIILPKNGNNREHQFAFKNES